jgi:hypothetical protein
MESRGVVAAADNITPSITASSVAIVFFIVLPPPIVDRSTELAALTRIRRERRAFLPVKRLVRTCVLSMTESSAVAADANARDGGSRDGLVPAVV